MRKTCVRVDKLQPGSLVVLSGGALMRSHRNLADPAWQGSVPAIVVGNTLDQYGDNCITTVAIDGIRLSFRTPQTYILVFG